VLPANVQLDWKVIVTNTLAYLASSSATKKTKFYNIDTRRNQGIDMIKLFAFHAATTNAAGFPRLVQYLQVRPIHKVLVIGGSGLNLKY